jgi:ssDNA-specific exonuclease RecJ
VYQSIDYEKNDLFFQERESLLPTIYIFTAFFKINSFKRNYHSLIAKKDFHIKTTTKNLVLLNI